MQLIPGSRRNQIHSNRIVLAFHFGHIVRKNPQSDYGQLLGRGSNLHFEQQIRLDNKKNRYRIEKSFATDGRVIVSERKVNTEGGQTNRICLSTLRQLLKRSWEVPEARNQMKHAFVNAQSNAMFSLQACVALCIHNRHLTGRRVHGANMYDTRQDGSKRSRQEQTNTRGDKRVPLCEHQCAVRSSCTLEASKSADSKGQLY